MLTQAKLKEVLHYDPETGDFTWQVSTANCIKVGALAGSKDSYGYHKIAIKGKTYKAHRLAWLYTHGEFPEDAIDHINGVRDDNRIVNLRAVTIQENQRNQKKFVHNTSGTTGVHWHKRHGRWQARVFAGGKRIHLGSFVDLDLAIEARQKADKLHNFHPNHGRGI